MGYNRNNGETALK